MKIRFERGVDDILAFSRYHNSQSSTLRRYRIAIAFSVSVIFNFFAVLGIFSRDLGKTIACIAVGSLVPLLMILPGPWNWIRNKLLRRMANEGANRVLLGTHELELTKDFLISSSPLIESRIKLELLERVEGMEGYTIIYLSALSAIVIAHRRVIEGDPEAFANELRKNLHPQDH